MITKNFKAAKAFIVRDGKVLIIRESLAYEDGTSPGIYDIPGGRVDDETELIDCLIRETKEETGLDISIGEIFHQDEWRPIVRDEQWIISGFFYACSIENDEINLSQDHDLYEWIDPKDYKKYNLHKALQNTFKKYLEK